jgi:hypothetical protein
MSVTRYPFEPKSTAHLMPGQFWAIGLSDGRYGCGRVLDVPRTPDPAVPVSSRTFLAGLMDWAGSAPPTESSIAGASLLRQGFAHIRTIHESGSAILGRRDLELDAITPYLWRDATGGANVWVYAGAQRVRPWERGERVPVMSMWGLQVIRLLAERALVRGQPLVE